MLVISQITDPPLHYLYYKFRIIEIEAVNQSLDSLSNALDMIEERTDGIKARLLELLNSNKEIRESIVAEKSQDTEASK